MYHCVLSKNYNFVLKFMKYKIRAIYTREALNYCEQDEMSCAEIEVDHNVRHNTFSEIYLCRKFYV